VYLVVVGLTLAAAFAAFFALMWKKKNGESAQGGAARRTSRATERANEEGAGQRAQPPANTMATHGVGIVLAVLTFIGCATDWAFFRTVGLHLRPISEMSRDPFETTVLVFCIFGTIAWLPMAFAAYSWFQAFTYKLQLPKSTLVITGVCAGLIHLAMMILAIRFLRLRALLASVDGVAVLCVLIHVLLLLVSTLVFVGHYLTPAFLCRSAEGYRTGEVDDLFMQFVTEPRVFLSSFAVNCFSAPNDAGTGGGTGYRRASKISALERAAADKPGGNTSAGDVDALNGYVDVTDAAATKQAGSVKDGDDEFGGFDEQPPPPPPKQTPPPAAAAKSAADGGVVTIEILGTWPVTYLGNKIVEGGEGDALVEGARDAIVAAEGADELVNSAAHIRVSARTVRVTDANDGTPIDGSWVKVITYVTVVDGHKDAAPGNKVFCYISKNVALEFHRCWLFECAEATGIELSKAVRTAFVLNRDLPNPFEAPKGQELVKPPQTISGHEIRRHFLNSTGVVGAGQFGEVHLAQMDEKGRGGTKGDMTTVAVKLLKMTAQAEDRDEFIRECEAMLELRGADNLCQVHGVSVRRRPWLCIIEFLKYGDVQGLLKNCKSQGYTVNLTEMLYMAQQVANGMSFMESKGWIHMDLAARNVLVHSGLICKVADFGLSRPVDPATRKYIITKAMKLPVKWLAIESMRKQTFSIETDVWAYGVTVWEFFAYGDMPFKGTPNAHVLTFLEDGTRLLKRENCPQNVYDLIKRTWEVDPQARPSFTELADELQVMMDEAGGLVKCRDIGFDLKGGKEFKPSTVERGNNTTLQRQARSTLSLQTNTLVRNAPNGPMHMSLGEGEIDLDLDGVVKMISPDEGKELYGKQAPNEPGERGEGLCTYTSGAKSCRAPQLVSSVFCINHTCPTCLQAKRSREPKCENCANKGTDEVFDGFTEL
jgi:serine/threonine protein kinase